MNRSTDDVQQSPDEALAIPYGRNVSSQQGVKPKLPARGIEDEDEYQQREKHVGPRPLGRRAGCRSLAYHVIIAGEATCPELDEKRKCIAHAR